MGCSGKCFSSHSAPQRSRAASSSSSGSGSPTSFTREKTVNNTASSSRSMAASWVGISPARSMYSCAWTSASVRETSCTVLSGRRTRTQGSVNRLNSISCISFLLFINQTILTVIMERHPRQMGRQRFIQQ